MFKFILKLIVNALVYLAFMAVMWLAMIWLFLQGLRFWGASI